MKCIDFPAVLIPSAVVPPTANNSSTHSIHNLLHSHSIYRDADIQGRMFPNMLLRLAFPIQTWQIYWHSKRRKILWQLTYFQCKHRILGLPKWNINRVSTTLQLHCQKKRHTSFLKISLFWIFPKLLNDRIYEFIITHSLSLAFVNLHTFSSRYSFSDSVVYSATTTKSTSKKNHSLCWSHLV